MIHVLWQRVRVDTTAEMVGVKLTYSPITPALPPPELEFHLPPTQPPPAEMVGVKWE